MTITGKEITKKEYEHQKQLNEIYFKKCQETGDMSLMKNASLLLKKMANITKYDVCHIDYVNCL